MIVIDRDKCTGCGACVRDCLRENLTVEDQKARVLGECFLCGHCVAVCPAAAVSLEDPGHSPEDVIEYDPDRFEIEPERLLNFIRFRRSIRQYADRPVETEVIRRVLEAGRFTETASNLQDVEFTVVRETLEQLKPLIWESLREIAEEQMRIGEEGNLYAARWIAMYDNWKKNPGNRADGLFFGAPVLLVITSTSKWNGLLAAESVELMANACGLGCLFSGFTERAVDRSQVLREELGLGEKKIDACLLMGYPDVTYWRTTPRKAAQICWK